MQKSTRVLLGEENDGIKHAASPEWLDNAVKSVNSMKIYLLNFFIKDYFLPYYILR